jgi:hypothetical protein
MRVVFQDPQHISSLPEIRAPHWQLTVVIGNPQIDDSLHAIDHLLQSPAGRLAVAQSDYPVHAEIQPTRFS